jgi:hypothetical protein
MTDEITTAQAEEVAETALAESMTALQKAEAVPCETPEEYDAVVELMQDIKASTKEVEAKRVEMKAPILKAGKLIDGLFRPALERYKKVQSILKVDKAAPYLKKKAAARLEAERAAQAVVDKERNRLALLAVKAAARGDEKKAAQFEERSEAVAPVEAVVPEEKSPVVIKKKWRARLRDKELLVSHISGTGDHLEAVTVDMAYLNGLAVETGGRAHIPGVEFYQEETVVVHG